LILKKLYNKKVLLAPATPLTISFAKVLEKEDIKVIGFIDKNKTGKNIYKYENLSNIKFDLILIYNDLFFMSIYENILKYVNKKIVYRVIYHNNKYQLLNNKEIRFQLRKEKFFKFKIEIYQKIQKTLSSLFDKTDFKRKYIVILTKNHIGANSKYMYLYLSNNNYRIFLISKDINAKQLDKNYLIFNSLKSYIIISLAKVIIIDEIIYEYFHNFSKKQITIQLWHGLGIKKLFPVKNIHFSYFISTSNKINEVLYKELFIAKKFLNYGYPRNDIFFREVTNNDLKLSDKKIFDLSKNNKIILYMPTYRDLLEDNIPPFNFEELNQVFKKMEVYLIVKLHPFIQNQFTIKYSNIIFFPSKKDIYPILKYTNILITDYSSIIYDFLLLDRPIIAFVYDIEKFYATRNGFAFDYDSYTPAKQVKTQKELISEIYNIFSGKDIFKNKRKKLLEELFDYKDGNAAKRIKNLIIKDKK